MVSRMVCLPVAHMPMLKINLALSSFSWGEAYFYQNHGVTHEYKK